MIFSTLHGSHLYGLQHEGSDMDIFTVTDSTAPGARQHVVDGVDTVEVGFNTFLIRALGGSHQSVEALFSPYKVWNQEFEHLKPFIEASVVCGTNVYEKYERTIRKFCFGDFKRRVHACRLYANLCGLRENGRFNPAMTDEERQGARLAAEYMEGERLWTFLME
jgi:hypothetical protein